MRLCVFALTLLTCGSDLPAASGAQAKEQVTMRSVLLSGVPHVEQKPDFCGEACAAMWLAHIGHRGDQDWVFDQTGLDPLLGRGAYARELAQGLTRIGFQTGPGWYTVPADDDAALSHKFQELHGDLLSGVPSIVCMHADARPDTTEHFRLILGYDAKKDEVIYHEPAEAGGDYRRMGRALFLRLWPLKYDRSRFTVIRFRLAGRALRDGDEARTPTAADYAQHVMRLQRRLPRGFSLALSPPFVVLGDVGPKEVRRWAEGTVAWTVRHLKALYFPRDPDEILDIWLFKDDASYRRYTKEIFDDEPETPYGYYSAKHGALVMNIATGGGTLVHEIVHPYVRANFPAAPAWLNEGLGSLYEQSAEADGHIVGLTNWRLSGLQRAIRAGRVPSFAALTGSTEKDFYEGRHQHTGYGQARYLLYYLQEKGLLVSFYQRFHAARGQDPSGYKTLQAVLGEADMADFQKRWERFVLELVFRG